MPSGTESHKSGSRNLKVSVDQVRKPPHYRQHPKGIECIDVVEELTFNLGNAVKYIWRAGIKTPDWKTDLEKAMWYVQREIERLGSRDAEGHARKRTSGV